MAEPIADYRTRMQQHSANIRGIFPQQDAPAKTNNSNAKPAPVPTYQPVQQRAVSLPFSSGNYNFSAAPPPAPIWNGVPQGMNGASGVSPMPALGFGQPYAPPSVPQPSAAPRGNAMPFSYGPPSGNAAPFSYGPPSGIGAFGAPNGMYQGGLVSLKR